MNFIKKIWNKNDPSTIDSIIELIDQKVSSCSPEEEIRFLLELDNRLYPYIGQAAIRYGNGIHTKHQHIKYHDFFIRNIQPGERVLDLGCGDGTCAYDIVTHVPGCKVVGIDLNEKSITFAQNNYAHENLMYIKGDIVNYNYSNQSDVVILSNVLEHIEDRISFLIYIRETINPEKWLIRVPVYERDWRVPLKDELSIDYRLDPTHFTEYKKGEFEQELIEAGLKIMDDEYGWGEMWCVVSKTNLDYKL
ncbi:methyltransferase domain-containing protein [uncultured Methanospirillum sp.]|uniref:class I SAM-dependent methyltransferase n=1 Tax=uncultured Methanospirillum sp. TaxID=262503 RepID=UPI0029C73A20|nr:methyltransferase domain-containing protein [uncultured Methanospirillum sp.]